MGGSTEGCRGMIAKYIRALLLTTEAKLLRN